MSGALDQLFCGQLVRRPNEPWLICRSTQSTYADLDEVVCRLAGQFDGLGLSPGDRVAIFMQKSPAMVAALLACSRLRLIAVPLHTVLKTGQLNHILTDASVKVLVIDTGFYENLWQGLSASSLSAIVTCNGAAFDIESLPASDEADTLPERFSEAELILYTSGSTGKPKGVVVSRTNIRIGAESVAEYLGLSPSDRMLALLPFAFDYGLNQLTSSLASGARLVLMDFLLAADVVRQVKAQAVTVMAGVPPLWMKLLRADWHDDAGASVRLLTNSGGKLPVAVQGQLLSTFRNADLVLMYGLTEAFRSTFLPANLRDQFPDSMGIAIPGVQLCVVGDDGEVVESVGEGELVHCGPLVTLGYWGDEDRSRERYRLPPIAPGLQSETGLAVWSGDRVRQDENQLLYFLGREDGLIKSSGYRISPEDVEDAAYTIPGVQEAVVLGVDDAEFGQKLMLIVGMGDCSLAEADVVRHLRMSLPEYMVPRGVCFLKELPRTPTGKFDRKALRGLVA